MALVTFNLSVSGEVDEAQRQAVHDAYAVFKATLAALETVRSVSVMSLSDPTAPIGAKESGAANIVEAIAELERGLSDR